MLVSLCSPPLCSLTLTRHIGRPCLSAPCMKLLPILNCCMKSSASFFSVALRLALFASSTAPRSPRSMMSSSTRTSFSRQCIVLMSMTSARCTSHFRARRNRNNKVSGWSFFTMLQKAVRSSSGVWVESVCWNSAVWPYLSFSSVDGLGDLGGFEEVVEVREPSVAAEETEFFCDREKRPKRFLDFLLSLEEGSVSVCSGWAVSSGEEGSGTFGSGTPKTSSTAAQSWRSLASSSAVRWPRWPGESSAGMAGRSLDRCEARGALSDSAWRVALGSFFA